MAVKGVCDDLLKRLTKLIPPFDGHSYARLLSVRVAPADVPVGHGTLSFIDGSFVIHVPRCESVAQKNFTICHELGHVLILTHAGSTSVVGNDSAHRLDRLVCEEETIADLFAVNLLMPRCVFREHAGALAPGMKSLAALSTRFQTSLDATARRLVELDVWPCMALWCEPRDRPRRPAAAYVKRCYASPSFRFPVTVTPGTDLNWLYQPVHTARREGAQTSNPIEKRLTPRLPNEGCDKWFVECVSHVNKDVLAFITEIVPGRAEVNV